MLEAFAVFAIGYVAGIATMVASAAFVGRVFAYGVEALERAERTADTEEGE